MPAFCCFSLAFILWAFIRLSNEKRPSPPSITAFFPLLPFLFSVSLSAWLLSIESFFNSLEARTPPNVRSSSSWVFLLGKRPSDFRPGRNARGVNLSSDCSGGLELEDPNTIFSAVACFTTSNAETRLDRNALDQETPGGGWEPRGSFLCASRSLGGAPFAIGDMSFGFD